MTIVMNNFYEKMIMNIMMVSQMMFENLGYEAKIKIIFGSFCFLIYSNANSIMKFMSYWNASEGFFVSSRVKVMTSSYPSVVKNTSK